MADASIMGRGPRPRITMSSRITDVQRAIKRRRFGRLTVIGRADCTHGPIGENEMITTVMTHLYTDTTAEISAWIDPADGLITLHMGNISIFATREQVATLRGVLAELPEVSR